MSQEPDRIGRLIRLKRHEKPPDGYFEAFLEDLHRRQRSELLKRSSRGLFLERLKTYFDDPGGEKWAYAPVVAIFVLAVFALFVAAGEPELPAMPVADIGWGEVSLVSSGGPPAGPNAVDRGYQKRTVFLPDRAPEEIHLSLPVESPEEIDLSLPVESPEPLIPPVSRRFYR